MWGGGIQRGNHGLSEPCLSKLQESRKLMLFDVLTMMGGRGGQRLCARTQPCMDLGTLCLDARVGGPARCKCARASALTSGRGRRIDVV